jgi:pimeloyl-ACP methyl ester carboxylesterase
LGFHPAVGIQLLDEDPARSFLYGQLGSLTDPPSPLEVIEVLMSIDYTEDAVALNLPTLFVVGENDPIFPPALIETAARSVPGSRVAVVADTGHSPYFERPGEWNGIVARFLADSSV